ncbi:hypothetical protein [Solilutibacter silvestris]|uniref:DUF4352 domain-containing protein n=1 Tax=Solilutibacter silvestris TaxID=1645665 RepID=A0A2K1Q2D7_9GAMM|nr:hypothetical protein [Lysobacter silvestris]PNS09218.1 hypothetical protein Lysil_0847 [Lysobacter silvestris]
MKQHMHAPKIYLLAFTASILLGACSGPANNPGIGADKPPQPATTEPASTDPNAINSPLAAEAFKGKVTLTGQPTLSADKKSLVYQFKVQNSGTAALYSVGKHPIHIGIAVIGTSGSVDTDGGIRDFSRADLPLIPAGETATVTVNVPVDPRMQGRKLRFALVQEGAGWRDDAQSVAESDTSELLK